MARPMAFRKTALMVFSTGCWAEKHAQANGRVLNRAEQPRGPLANPQASHGSAPPAPPQSLVRIVKHADDTYSRACPGRAEGALTRLTLNRRESICANVAGRRLIAAGGTPYSGATLV